MKRIGIVLLLAAGSLWAYENYGLPDMSTPSELTAGQAEFILDHRFRGLVNDKPVENLFGMHGGANVGLGFRVSAGKGLDISLSHVIDTRESGFTIGYSFNIPSLPLRAKLEARLFSFRPVLWEENRKTSELLSLAIQAKPIAGRVIPVVNLLYDANVKFYDVNVKKWRFAIGCDLLLTKKFHAFGEFYPTSASQGPEYAGQDLKNGFVFGLKVLTWGHQFYFLLGNGSEPLQYMPIIGNRLLSMGSVSNDLHFGFAIHRLIEF
jgi:hypothetical protein